MDISTDIDERVFNIREKCWDYLLEDKHMTPKELISSLVFISNLINENMNFADAFNIETQHPANNTEISLIIDLMTLQGLEYNIKETPIKLELRNKVLNNLIDLTHLYNILIKMSKDVEI